MKNADDLQYKCLESADACVKFLKEVVEGKHLQESIENVKAQIEASKTIMAYANGEDLRANNEGD